MGGASSWEKQGLRRALKELGGTEDCVPPTPLQGHVGREEETLAEPGMVVDTAACLFLERCRLSCPSMADRLCFWCLL